MGKHKMVDRLTTIERDAQKLTTEGASFGMLVGKPYQLPRHPGAWTHEQLDALRHAQAPAIEQSSELRRWWERLMDHRNGLFADAFTLRQIGASEASCREALETEPERARAALAEDRCFSNPRLALAGHDLYQALRRLMAVSRTEACVPGMGVERGAFHDTDSTLGKLAEKPGNAVALAGGVKIGQLTARRRCLVLEGPMRSVMVKLNGEDAFSFLSRKGDTLLRDFLEAYHGFVREALLDRMVLAVTLSPCDGASLESRVLEGLEPADKSQNRLYRLDADSAALTSVNAFPLDAVRNSLPADSAHREALADALIAEASVGRLTTEIVFALERRIALIGPLAAPAPAPLSAMEKVELLALAKDQHPEIADHVTVMEGGRYRVTRHDLCAPLHLLDTPDVAFAIGLALAHKVKNARKLRLAVG